MYANTVIPKPHWEDFKMSLGREVTGQYNVKWGGGAQ